MHLLPNGKVFYSGPSSSSALFDPSTTSWALNVATTNNSDARTYGFSVLLPLTPANNYDPKIIIMGEQSGHQPHGNHRHGGSVTMGYSVSSDWWGIIGADVVAAQ